MFTRYEDMKGDEKC